MFRNKEEQARKKERKRKEKEAKKEAKEKARRAKVEAELAKERKRQEEIAKKEGYYDHHKPLFDYSDFIGDVKDVWSAARQGNILQLQEYLKQGIGVGARDKVNKNYFRII